MGEADSVSAYDMIVSWLISPSCIFLFVNLVIGTIFITSRFAAQRKNQPDSLQQVVPTSSFFDRVASFGLGCCKFKPPATSVESQVEPVQNQDLDGLNHAITSTELDQVKSIDTDLCETGTENLIQNPLPRAPSLLERLMSGNFGRLKSVKVEDEKKIGSEMEEEEVDAKADDFIKRFKQQLRLERLDSILRYRDVLHRRS
ncbi:pathogen-associated molecular patterns-induced protein A70-like [Vicia villosa]|uniref:pathogen-associated molecular patterns-induced protein A70-like n=1 Tax=Vicia villosa TaxID=3911 RepID=UPI00273AF76F|nr:pathogen-associated molecular patterns-induced protein A70-like [Vicia villosa]